MPLSDAVINITLTDKKIPQKEYLSKGVYPVFDQGQKYIGGYTDTEEKLVECELPVIVFGDHTRVIKFVNRPFVAGADGVKVLQPKRFYSPQLLEYFTLHIATYLTNHGYARHYQHLVKSTIPLPPINEQQRIVAKIEALFSELDNGIASLKTARDQLKIYRQALLKHAFSGKLTEQWRAENQDKLETAEVLLQRIKTEREQCYQQQLKDWEAKGKQGSKPKVPKVLTPLTAEELAELPEIPKGWAWTRLGSINVDVFDGPFGSNLKSSDYVQGGVRVVRLENIGVLEFIENKETYVTEEKYDLLKKHTVSAGDIIFSSFITENVRVTLLPANITRAINKADCFCVRVFGETMQNVFMVTFLSTRHVYKQFEALIHGVGRPRINTTQLKDVSVPVCSVAEQKVIIAEIESRFSDIDQLDQTLTTALQQAEALRQSILKKAFSGQLVPQDPSDEPASVLLERIQAEKVKLNIQTPSSRGKKTVTKHRSPSC